MEEHLVESVRFTRDGRRLLLRDGDKLALVELPTGDEHSLAGGGGDGAFATLRAFAGFEDEVWVVCGEARPQLWRFTNAGAALGAPVPLPPCAGPARLIPAPSGAPSAIWIGVAPCEIRRDADAIAVDAIAPGADLLLPIEPRRRVELRDGTLIRVEPEGTTPLTSAGHLVATRMIEGAVILDGRAAALVLDREGVQTLLVVALQSGLVQHRIALSQIRAARFAPARGHAMLLVGDRSLLVVDLRFGRTLTQWEEPGRVTDFAIDAAARSLVLQRRAGDGGCETFYGTYRDVVGAPAALREPPPSLDRERRSPDASHAAGDRGPPPGDDEKPADVHSLREAPPEPPTVERPARHATASEPSANAVTTTTPRSTAGARSRGTRRPPPARPLTAGVRDAAQQSVAPTTSGPTARHPPARPLTTAHVARAGAPMSGAFPPDLRPARPKLGSTILELPAPRSPEPPPVAAPPGVPPPPLDLALDLVTAWCDLALAIARDEGWAPPPAHHDASEVVPTLHRPARGLAAAERAAAETVAATALMRFAARRGEPPLGALASQLRLSPLALDLLLVAAAPWLRPELASIYALLGGTPGGEANLVVASRLLADAAPGAILDELGEDAPLRRHGVVGMPAGPASPLLVDPLVVRRLRGDAIDEPGAHGALAVPFSARALPELALPEGLADALSSRFAATPRLLLRGRRGSGRRTLVFALAAAHGRRPGFVDVASARVAASDRASYVARGLREATLRGLLPCAVGVDYVEPAVADRVAAVLASHHGALVLIGGPSALPIDGFETINLSPITTAARCAFLASALMEQQLPADAAPAIAGRLRVTPGDLRRIVEATAAREWPDGSHADLESAFAAAHRRLRAERLTPGHTLAAPSAWQPALLDATTEDAMAELRVRADRARVGARGVIALLAGADGTGRRLAAEILAAQLGVDLHRVAAADVTADHRAFARLLEEAEDGGLLLHVTEADRLLASPLAPPLWSRLTCFGGVALLSIGDEATVDEAVRPLVATRVPFPRPDAATRAAIWRLHLPRGVDGIDASALARHALTGGEIRAAAERALLLAESEGSTARALHFERAARVGAAQRRG